MKPALFQDDVSRFCLDPITAQMGNDKMEAVAETKLLDYNMDKSCYIIIGKGKERKNLANNMKVSNEEKYLGDQIHGDGLAASVDATIGKRSGKVTKAINDIQAVIDDCRSSAIGGITAGLDIWELAVIPYL